MIHHAQRQYDVGAQFIAPDLSPDTSAFDPGIHHRRSMRLRNYDYSQAGAYFITLCTQKRECLFGAMVGDIVQLNEAGRLVQNIWGVLPEHYSCVELDSFVVMPNHIHGIVVLNGVGAQFIAPNNNQGVMALHSHSTNPSKTMGKWLVNRAPTVGEIIRAFKARCTHGINQLRSVQGVSLWQRNYYEHVIRNESSLQEIREYIANNPAQWAIDRENPNAVGARFIAPNYDDAENQGAMALHSHSTNPSKTMGKWLVNRAPTGSKGIKA